RKAIAYATDDRKMQTAGEERYAVIPANAFTIPVNREQVLANKVVEIKDSARIVDAITWRVGRSAVMKNHFMVLDLLANNDWTRPIYFAVTTGPDSYIGLQDHFQLEGLTYRVVPMYSPSDPRTGSAGSVAVDRMLRTVTEKFKWGNMETEEDIYLDENILRMTTNLRLQLSALAEELIALGRKEDARIILDLSIEKMPDRNVPFDRVLLPTVEAYYAIGDTAKGNALSERLFTIMEENLNWFASLEPEFVAPLRKEADITEAVMGRLADVATRHDSLFGAKLEERFQAADEAYQMSKAQKRRTTRMRF
ncbi:MAG: hypothetical protein JNM49_03115, partial [Flavobacteriales bacterium]|nr:hypothetical protein [Flavobacteriales bacterium]